MTAFGSMHPAIFFCVTFFARFFYNYGFKVANTFASLTSMIGLTKQRKEVNSLSVKDRREDIWFALCERRQDTIEHLATEFDVSPRTIRYDIDALSLTHPIETVRGRYGGGVKVSHWYRPSCHTLSPEQIALLKRLTPSLEGNDLVVINSILLQFAP